MKKKVAIYIDSEVWHRVRMHSVGMMVSASQFIEDLCTKHFVSLDDDAEKSLDKEKVPKKEPKKTVIKTVADIPSTFRSYSKDQQLGKKGEEIDGECS